MTSSIGMDAVDVALTNERNGYSSFNADYTPSPETIAKATEVFDYIEANPKNWYQASYGTQDSETNCWMGILARLNGKTANYPFDYFLWEAMDIIELSGESGDLHEDRAEYIAEFTDVRDRETGNWRPPTLDEMRERVSIALNYDFRTPNTRAFNDPIVDCCERDAADCDC